MSVKIDLADLETTIAKYETDPYVITVGSSGRPHLSHSRVAWRNGALHAAVGRSSLTNAIERPQVVVLWAPSDNAQMSLIVDGTGSAQGDGLEIVPSAAVLHRRADAQ